MTTKNLWGNIPTQAAIRTPHSILAEQAQILTEATHGLLNGEVVRGQDNGKFVNTLKINAPTLNNYFWAVMTVTHDITLYPVTIWSHTNVGPKMCQNESAFIFSVEEILSSQQVHGVISALLAQVAPER